MALNSSEGYNNHEPFQNNYYGVAKFSKADNSSFLKAVRAGDFESVFNYLDSGRVDVNACNNNGLNALHLAAKDGYVDIINLLIERGCPVDSKSKKGNTPLHVASLAGQLEIAIILVENGAEVNMQSQAGFTPLYMAAQENHAEVVRFLLDRGASPAIATEDNYTPMAVAVQQNNREVVDILIEHEQRGKTKLSPLHLAAKKNDVHATVMLLQGESNLNLRTNMVNEATKSGFTPLHIASHYGNIDVAKVLIQNGSNVNAKAKSSICPLHVSSKWGRVTVVQLLISSGAVVDCRTKDNLTPLHCASRSGFGEVVEVLVTNGAEISSKTKHGLTPLHMAAQGDHVATVRLLVSYGAPLDEVTVDFLTPLHVAAHCGSYSCAKVLLDNNCQVDAKALNGFTPLHIACKKNRIRVIELLLQYGAEVDSTTETGLTPMHVASFMGYTEIVRILLSQKANIHAVTDKGEACLHLATRGNQLEVMSLLLENGADVNVKAKEKQTPLHSAARTGSLDAVQLLLSNRADVNAVTNDNYTPLHAAAKEGHEEVIQILMDKGADPKIKTKKSFTPLHIASKYGFQGAANMLISQGADVNVESKNGLTPVHLAAHYNQPILTRLLLSKKASPHSAAKNGYTALHIAAKYNEVDIASYLLEHKAKTNAESKNGFTPLHLASQEGHLEMVVLLLENRAKVNHQSKNGLSALHLAAQEDQVPVGEILLKYKADIDPQTKAGYTPLHTACHFGKLNMIDFLLRNGANVRASTKVGYTPLHQAAQQGHVLATQMLLKHQANPDDVANDGRTALSIADQLGYISVAEILSEVTTVASQEKITDERYDLLEPEVMHDAPMSDEEEDDKGELGEQNYTFIATKDDMRGLGDDSSQHNRDSYLGERNSFPAPSQDDLHLTQKQNLANKLNVDPTNGKFKKVPPQEIRVKPSQMQETHFDDNLTEVVPHHQNMESYVNGTSYNKQYPEQYDEENKKKLSKVEKEAFENYKESMRKGDEDGRVKLLTRSGEEDWLQTSNKASKPSTFEHYNKNLSGTSDKKREILSKPSTKSDQDNNASNLNLNNFKLSDHRQLIPTQNQRIISPSPSATAASGTHGIPYFKSNISETDSHVFGSTYSGMSYASSFDPDNVALSRQPIFQGFLVSFIVDARGGAMRGCRHSGIRIIVPPGRASQPTRVTCKLVKKDKVQQLPPLLEGEALASRILVLGPAGAKFLGSVILEVPHFASLQDSQREIVVWKSDNGYVWKEHTDLGNLDTVQKAVCGSFDDLESAEDLYHRRITRIISPIFPKYFALVTRIKQDVTTLGPQGGVIVSSTMPQVQVSFPQGALTKPIKLSLQTQSLSDEFVKKMVGNRVSVSPIATVEPRRRKFHKPITITLPLDPELVHNNKAIDKSPSLRLLCSMNDGMDPTEWEDITGTVPMTLVNNSISFPIAVSARYWLVNTPRYKEAVMLANPMFGEASVVPFIANFVVFAKRRDPLDGQLRIFCMTDDKMDKTLESQERFIEVARSRDIEVLDERPQWIECQGNLIPVLKSDHTDKQPYINFRAFKENRLSLNVRVRDLSQDPFATLFFMSEPRDVKEQHPLCTLQITLPSMEEQQKINSANDVTEIKKKLDQLHTPLFKEEDQISKTELRLTDIAECLEEDWIPLALKLGITEKDVAKIQTDYSYIPEQALVMLHLWMEKKKEVASGNTLEKALRELGREDIIQKCIYFLQDVTDENEIKQARNVIFSNQENEKKLNESNFQNKDEVFYQGNDGAKAALDSEEGSSSKRSFATNHSSTKLEETSADLTNLEEKEIVKEKEDNVDWSRVEENNKNSTNELFSTNPVRGVELSSLSGDLLGNLSNDQYNMLKAKGPHAFEDWVERKEMKYNETSLNENSHKDYEEEEEELMEGKKISSSEDLLRQGEKNIEVRVEMADDDQSLDDGRSVRRQVITRSYLALPKKEDNLERVVKVEIEEDILELPPGVADPGDVDPQLMSTKTQVYKETGYFSDCLLDENVPFERKVTRTMVCLQGANEEKTIKLRPIKVPKYLPNASAHFFSDQSDPLVVTANQVVASAVHQALHYLNSKPKNLEEEGRDWDNQVAVRVYTDTVEDEPEENTDVQEFEETLEDGSVVRRKIVKTQRKQTIIKRVVMEGPEEELPMNEEEAQELLKQVDKENEEALIANLPGDKENKTEVQEFEEVQKDGSVVKRKVVTTTEQQLTTDKVVLEGDVSVDDEEEENYSRTENSFSSHLSPSRPY